MRPPTQARIQQLIVLVLALCLLCQGMLFARPRRASKSNLQAQQQAIQRKIYEKRAGLRAARAKALQTKKKLQTVEHKLLAARGELQYRVHQLHIKQIELHQAVSALARAKQEFESNRRQASGRLVAMYQRGEPGYLDLMLSSDNFGDMLQRAQLANYVMDQDTTVLTDLKDRKEKLDHYQNVVAEKKQEAAVAQDRAAEAHERVADQRTVVAKNLSSQRQQIDQMMDELTALERDSNAVTAMLRAMQNTSKGRRLRNAHYAGPLGGLPVAGHITSGFGYRYHPILHYRRLHTGVDIAAPIGTPVHAGGGGEVIWAGPRGGYGNAVMIDHGGGRVTLYGHMSALAAHSGEVVSKGEVIGYVGSTGMSTGPHLHYELRVNGSPVNPL